ncbi:general substrate transporter [Lentinus brumalis]|uniref:General substrate transporter n=1 Tax=Lentinus brumalis TaxID=2498619 RepID=A0A371CQ54_9APHY|nr:general substrate transporter [Polyporus brumalis]
MGADTRFQNIRVYWLAFIAYWGIVLFGYDTGIGGGVVSQNYFKEYFGLLNPDGTTNQSKSDNVSSLVVSVLQAGAFFGALGSAPISAAIGRRWALLSFMTIFSVGAILQTVAGGSRGIGYIYAGRVVAGVGIGAISAVAPAYVSECSPKDVRGRITGLFQIMVAIGVMISYFINLGIGLHIPTGPNVWRIPFGFQLVPAGIMSLGLFTTKESPRWLASKGRYEEALTNLAYLRKRPVDDEHVRAEMAEIEAAIEEERDARQGLGLREAIFGKGNLIRFIIAIVIFVLQQWSGQNSVNYYAPRIFSSIGYSGTTNSLLASGIYGIVKVVSTALFVFFLADTLGRKMALFISAIGMGTLFFIIGALLKTHPPPNNPGGDPPPASKAMAAMLYIYVCFYSMGWGPLPWVYVSDIFPTRTRHYGLATASASQWLFNFVLSKVTPTLVTDLGYKIFLMFATINIGGMAVFALLIPETKGRSLEEMDIIFGTVSADQRKADIEKRERALEHEQNETLSERSLEHKV